MTTELATILDYLPVALRAAERNPGNNILRGEAFRAQRAVINYGDAHLHESAAADVQAIAGHIAHYATRRDDLASAERAETAKRRIRLLCDDLPFDQMTEAEVVDYLAERVIVGYIDALAMPSLVRELQRRGTVTDGVFWWLVDRAHAHS